MINGIVIAQVLSQPVQFWLYDSGKWWESSFFGSLSAAILGGLFVLAGVWYTQHTQEKARRNLENESINSIKRLLAEELKRFIDFYLGDNGPGAEIAKSKEGIINKHWVFHEGHLACYDVGLDKIGSIDDSDLKAELLMGYDVVRSTIKSYQELNQMALRLVNVRHTRRRAEFKRDQTKARVEQVEKITPRDHELYNQLLLKLDDCNAEFEFQSELYNEWERILMSSVDQFVDLDDKIRNQLQPLSEKLAAQAS